MTRRKILGLTVWPPLPYGDMVQAVRDAEAAGIDFVRIPDIAAFGTKHEALALAAALSTMSSKIGLVPAASLDFNDPYNLARALATVDHLAHGRAGWQATSCAAAAEAQNFGHDEIAPKALPHARAAELLDVLGSLHDSWDEGAVPRDKTTGMFFDRAGMRVLSHRGDLFRVRGPLDVPTSPQRQLPLFADLTLPEIAERYADVLIASQRDELEACVGMKARCQRDIRILVVVDADDRELAVNMRDETADGIVVVSPDVCGFVRNVLPGLGHQPGSGRTFREVLGLSPVRSRYEERCRA